MKKIRFNLILFIGLFIMMMPLLSSSSDLSGLTPEQLLKIKKCSQIKISPDAKWIAYTVTVPRKAGDKPGSSYEELYLYTMASGKIKIFIAGEERVRSIQWKPDSSAIAFLTKRGDKSKTQVWSISINGGEARQITNSKIGVQGFRWHPKSNSLAYLAYSKKNKKDELLKKKGYGFIFYEENLKNSHLFMLNLNNNNLEQLTKDIMVWNFEFSPCGEKIALTSSKKNLVDHYYMFRKIYLLDLTSKKVTQLTKNPGKLGGFKFSPDATRIVYTRALDRKDHAVSQVYIVDVKSAKEKNLTPVNFRGHISWAVWKDNKTIIYQAGEGVYPTLSTVPSKGGKRKIVLDSKKTGVMFRRVSFSKNFKHFAFAGSGAHVPSDLYYGSFKKKPKQITILNPWLNDVKLGNQKVINYKARDGEEIEGILIYPTDYIDGNAYPLIVTVHGGPEGHYSNSWMSRYATPGQVLAGRGYVVFYPNYRASTGYGVKFALAGYKDAAGVEFDDIADGIDFLVKEGIADPKRVGLGGGSYGGYAAAWFASYYTKYVKAVCMFVGISDLISKRGTTDIPYEELYVHSGEILEKMWIDSLKRSPVYWAHQSKSAVLILGGTNDTRVHPSQSIEFYRRLKMNHHPAVRLVQYPGEGHGNRKQPGQIDALFRILKWYDWYVKDNKPLDGPMPALDISKYYGLDLSE